MKNSRKFLFCLMTCPIVSFENIFFLLSFALVLLSKLKKDFFIRSTCKEPMKITDISYTTENLSQRADYHSEICNFKHLTHQVFSPAPICPDLTYCWWPKSIIRGPSTIIFSSPIQFLFSLRDSSISIHFYLYSLLSYHQVMF